MVNLNKKNTKNKVGDFVRAKFKVGKIKPGAVNATDTSFQSRRLKLSDQKLSMVQKIEDGIREGFLLLNLIQPHVVHCTHYNVNMRREAYASILARCKEHNIKKLEQVVSTVFPLLGRGMVDNEEKVRNMVLSLTFFFFSAKVDLSLSFGGWISHLILASSHIDAGIRRDSIKFLELAVRLASPLIIREMGRIVMAFCTNKFTSKSAGCIIALVDAYCEAALRSPNEIIPTYVWQSEQREPLHSVRLRKPPPEATVDELDNTRVIQVVKWLGEQTKEDYLDAIPLLNNPNLLMMGEQSKERQAMQNLTFIHELVIKLCKATSVPVDDVIKVLPRSLVQFPSTKIMLDR